LVVPQFVLRINLQQFWNGSFAEVFNREIKLRVGLSFFDKLIDQESYSFWSSNPCNCGRQPSLAIAAGFDECIQVLLRQTVDVS